MAICKDISKLEPKFREKVELWLAKNPEVLVTETKRNYARQAYLVATKKSRTYFSKHLYGLAIDVGFEGKYLYPKDWAKWRKIADSAKEHGIDWGYDLWEWDKPHFQDDGTPFNPSLMTKFVIPEWAVKSCKKAKENGIITKDFDKPITAYRLCAILDNLGLLDSDKK